MVANAYKTYERKQNRKYLNSDEIVYFKYKFNYEIHTQKLHKMT